MSGRGRDSATHGMLLRGLSNQKTWASGRQGVWARRNQRIKLQIYTVLLREIHAIAGVKVEGSLRCLETQDSLSRLIKLKKKQYMTPWKWKNCLRNVGYIKYNDVTTSDLIFLTLVSLNILQHEKSLLNSWTMSRGKPKQKCINKFSVIFDHKIIKYQNIIENYNF